MEFLTDPWFVRLYCLGILLAGAYCVRRLRQEAHPLWIELRKASRRVAELGEEGFARDFDEIDEDWRKQFGTPWNEFVETLVRRGPDQPIRNSHEVSRHLNEAAIIFPRVSLDFYRAVPNLLTGVGILGTFVGLAAGVGLAQSGIASGQPDQITASLEELLGGASLAFMTSIFGIGASLAFVLFERFQSRALRLEVGKWAQAVESCLERVAHEAVALDQLDVAQDQLKELERFNTDLVMTLEQALEDKVAGRLAPLLTKLVDSMEQLRADRSSDATKMIEKILGEFTDAMRERTGEHFEELGVVVGDLNRALKNSSEEMVASQGGMRAAMEEAVGDATAAVSAGASAMLETLQRSLAEVSQRLSDASRQAADNIAAAAAAAARRVGEVLDALGQASSDLTASTEQSRAALDEMTSFAEKVQEMRSALESAQESFADIAAPIRNAADEIHSASARSAEALTGTADLVRHVNGLVEATEKHQQSIADAWSRHEARFEGIDASLANVFGELDAGLSGYCEQVKAFANELDKTTSNTIRDLAGATSELGQSIEDLIDYSRSAK